MKKMGDAAAEVEGDVLTTERQMFLTVLVNLNVEKVESATLVVDNKSEVDFTDRARAVFQPQNKEGSDEVDLERHLPNTDSQDIYLTPEFVNKSDTGELNDVVELCQMVQYCGGEEEMKALIAPLLVNIKDCRS